MPTSDEIIEQIKSAQSKLKIAESDLKKPRAPFMGGPMDIDTPWTADAYRVKWEKENIEELTKELGAQVLRERR